MNIWHFSKKDYSLKYVRIDNYSTRIHFKLLSLRCKFLLCKLQAKFSIQHLISRWLDMSPSDISKKNIEFRNNVVNQQSHIMLNVLILKRLYIQRQTSVYNIWRWHVPTSPSYISMGIEQSHTKCVDFEKNFCSGTKWKKILYVVICPCNGTYIFLDISNFFSDLSNLNRTYQKVSRTYQIFPQTY